MKDILWKQKQENRDLKQFDRIQNRENVIKVDNKLGKFFELATPGKIYVNVLSLHEIKNETFLEYAVQFQKIGSMLRGEIEQKTDIRLLNVDDFERFINAADVDFDSEDTIFTGRVHRLNKTLFIEINISQNGRGTKLKQDFF